MPRQIQHHLNSHLQWCVNINYILDGSFNIFDQAGNRIRNNETYQTNHTLSSNFNTLTIQMSLSHLIIYSV